MPHFGLTVDLAATAAFPLVPQIALEWEPDVWDFRNKCVDRAMYASFDGINDDVELTPNEPDEAKTIRTHSSKVWLRAVTGGTAPVTLRAEASTDA